MKRFCEYCKESFPVEYDKNRNNFKIVKLKNPIPEALVIGNLVYSETITHRCVNCGFGYGTAVRKDKLEET